MGSNTTAVEKKNKNKTQKQKTKNKKQKQKQTKPTDIEEGDTTPCAILIPPWGSNWGSSGFSRNTNNRGSVGA